MKILVATHNPGKRREYAALLADMDAEFLTLDDVGIDTDIEETGASLEENARLKAVGYARLSGLLTLADDSGLEVDALNGRPGVHSARYAGPGAGDADRYRKLLGEMSEVPDAARTARFRCVVALCTPEGEVYTADGVCEGDIGYEPRGEHGFGYDPVFVVAGQGGKTMAELPPDLKNRISHRAHALEAIKPTLARLIAGRTAG
ncbi:MAG: RdgB/HAM1 family non-canonical purine NTP pyrophosphatase [Anaerolineae bacterium]